MTEDEVAQHERPPEPRRRWWRVILLLLLVALAAGEWLASRAIKAKVQALADNKLDARLELGPTLYIPPMGMWTWGARLVRNGQPLITAARIKLDLAQLPLKGKPIVIARLRINAPAINGYPGAFDKLVKKTDDDDKGDKDKDDGPHKLSEMLQLREVRLFDGRFTYRDPKRPDAPPTEWSGLTLGLDTVRQTAAKYTFHFTSRATTLLDARATGSIDVDELLVDLQSVLVKGRAEPEPARSPLPAAVQQFLRKHRIAGQLAVSGSGRVPLRDARQAAFNVNVTLNDATAAIPPRDVMLDHARANLTARMQPAGPVVVRVNQLDLAAAGKQVIVDGGELRLDSAAGTWALVDLKGKAEFSAPTTTFAAAGSLRNVAPTSHPTTLPIDKYAIVGRADFTAGASGPFDLKRRDPWQAIEHEVILYPRGASFRPGNFARRIEGIGGGEVRLAGGMIIFQELAGHYADDQIQLRSARLPVKGLPKLAAWQEISGTATFVPPMHRYSPKLDKVLDALNPEGPFLIAGSYTLDKRTPDAKNTYDLIVSSDTGSFTLTDRNIRLAKIRGDATITPAGVDLHAAEAQVFEGTIQTTGRWSRNGEGEPPGYDAEVMLRDMDLSRLEYTLRASPPNRPLEGKLFAHVTLSGAVPRGADAREKLRQIKANGDFEIVRGNIFDLTVLRSISERVKQMKDARPVGDAAAMFEIADGTVHLRNAAVNSAALGIQGGGTVGVDGQLDLKLVAAPLADWKNKLKETRIPIVSNVVGELAGGIQKMLNAATGTLLYEFRVAGTVQDTKVTTVPTPVLTDTAAFVFERMLTPKKDQRPLDLLRNEHPPRAESR